MKEEEREEIEGGEVSKNKTDNSTTKTTTTMMI